MIFKIKPGFKKHNYFFRIFSRLQLLTRKRHVDYKHIPVIINNYNRLDYLLRQLEWLERAGMKRIYIIDNASTYKPLLEFYKNCKYTIFQLTENVGHTALWDTHVQLYFKNQYYIYTDPDIIPIEECPLDAVSYFKEILDSYPEITKVGFGLKIDDIPDYYPRRNEVIQWESKFWRDSVAKNLYHAVIDTTFALYRPNTRYQQWETTLRTGGNYIARHLPWYLDPLKPSDEELYFKKVTTNVSSWYKSGKYIG
jgi:hypothetical protein